eukprot:Lankesteria_metandrocarpae@DN4604_c0_g1_i3.p1
MLWKCVSAIFIARAVFVAGNGVGGVGVDVCRVSRIAKIVAAHGDEALASRMFSEKEFEVYKTRKEVLVKRCQSRELSRPGLSASLSDEEFTPTTVGRAIIRKAIQSREPTESVEVAAHKSCDTFQKNWERWSVQNLAKRWAMKESVAKSMGRGIKIVKREGLSLKEIQIFHNRSGQPFVELIGEARKLALRMGIVGFHVTVSDDGDYAVAFALTVTSDSHAANYLSNLQQLRPTSTTSFNFY